MFFERKQDPRGGDKNINDEKFRKKIIKQIKKSMKKDEIEIRQNHNRDKEMIEMYNDGESEVIYSNYVFPLVADCNIRRCSNGSSATGYILKDDMDDMWTVEFECKSDGFFSIWTLEIGEIVKVILSSEKNYVKIV